MEKKRVFLVLVIAIAVKGFCILPAGADPYLGGIPLETVKEGVVSGGLFGDATFPMTTDGTATFVLPDHSGIQWARLYVVVYCGHMQNNYQAQADIEFNGGQGIRKLATEVLNVPYSFPGEGGTGPVRLNDHTNRVTSDYLMWYDVADRILGKNVLVRVRTSHPPGYTGTFDGRVKAIVLVAAYEDGDQDRVHYWVNQGHDSDSELAEEMLGETYVGETTFSTRMLDEEGDRADLVIVHLASSNGNYDFRGDALPAGKPQGAYGGIDRHDVTDTIRRGKDSVLTYDNTARYFKIILATLAIRYPGTESGNLVVTSSPSGAAVTIDGEKQGQRTNATFSGMISGTHVVGVEKEGFRLPAPRTVLIETGKTGHVHFTLQETRSSLKVETIPAGAEVLVDGVKHGSLTPCVIDDLPAGEREIVVRLAGFGEWKRTLRLADGETLPLRLELLHPDTTGPSSGINTTAAGPGASGYFGSDLPLYRKGNLRGTFFVTSASDYSGMIPAGGEVTFTLPDPLPGNGTVALARLYLYTTWSHDTRKREGISAVPAVSWNGQELEADAVYTDRKGEGAYDYPVQTFAYDVSHVIRPGEQGTVTIRNVATTGEAFAVYGVLLVAVLEDASAPEIGYWIAEGSDIVFADPRFGTTREDACTRVLFDGSTGILPVRSARLLVVSTAASGGEDDQNLVLFNRGEWTNALSAGSSGISMADLDVLPWLQGRNNTAGIASLPAGGRGDYMENRNAILVIGFGERGVVPPGGEEILQGQKTGSVPTLSPAGPGSGRPAGGDDFQSPPVPPARKPRNAIDALIQHIFLVIFTIFGMTPPAAEGFDGLTERTPLSSDSGADLQHAAGEEEWEGGVQVREGPGQTYSSGIEPGGEEVLSPAETAEPPGETAPEQRVTGTEKPVTGGISVTSYPGGATVYINGRKVLSKTPMVANWLKPGVHTVRVELENIEFSPDTRQVRVESGEITPVAFAPGTPLVRTLTFETRDFDGAFFTVNGRGLALPFPATVAVEGHSPFITIRDDGRLYSLTIPPRVQDRSAVTVTRQGEAGAGIRVISSPPGARISIDGFATEQATPAVIGNLSAGQHLVRVSLPGHLPAEKLVTLVDFTGAPVDMSVSLSLEPYLSGNLTVESDPAGARILLFGKDTGEKTPATFEYLQVGTIQGRIRWDDAEKDFEVDILPERDVLVSVQRPKER